LRRTTVTSVVLAFALSGILAGQRRGGTELWMAGLDPITRPESGNPLASDFMELFAPDAPWADASARLQVLKVSTQFLVRGGDSDLSLMFSDLRRRHIALAVEGLMLTGNGTCGVGVEGYAAPLGMKTLAERVRALGGDLSYVAMDEPLWFGHVFDGRLACRATLAEIARDVAVKVADVRRLFPAVVVGDIEPIGSPAAPHDWIDQLMLWSAEYRAATGTPLAFVHADVQWSQAWQPGVETLNRQLTADGIRFGVIMNGDPDEATGVAWTSHASQRSHAVRRLLRRWPDFVIFQSWHAQPEKFLPEDRPGTLTNLVSRFRP